MKMKNTLIKQIDSYVVEKRDKLLPAALAIYIFARGIEMAEIAEPATPVFSGLARILQVIVLLVVGVLFISSALHHRAATNIILAVIGLLLITCSIFSRSYELIWSYLFIVSAENTSIKNIPKVVFYCSVLILLFVIALYVAGIANAVVITRSNSAELRSSLGFYHPNRLVEVYLLAVISYLMYKFKKVKFIDFCLISLGCLVLYTVTGTRTALLAVAAVLAVFLLTQWMGTKKRNLSSAVVPITFLIVSLASVGSALLYDENNQILSLINDALSGRLVYPSALYSAVGVPLFGMNMEGTPNLISNVPYFSSSIVPIDNYYNHVLFYNGPLIILIEFFALCLTAKFAPYKENENYYIGLLVCIILGISESYVGDIAFNFSIILVSRAVTEFNLKLEKRFTAQ